MQATCQRHWLACSFAHTRAHDANGHISHFLPVALFSLLYLVPLSALSLSLSSLHLCIPYLAVAHDLWRHSLTDCAIRSVFAAVWETCKTLRGHLGPEVRPAINLPRAQLPRPGKPEGGGSWLTSHSLTAHVPSSEECECLRAHLLTHGRRVCRAGVIKGWTVHTAVPPAPRAAGSHRRHSATHSVPLTPPLCTVTVDLLHDTHSCLQVTRVQSPHCTSPSTCATCLKSSTVSTKHAYLNNGGGWPTFVGVCN